MTNDPLALDHTYEDLQAREGTLGGTSWGLLDPEDRLGTLALQTPERRRAALAVPRLGQTFSLDTPLTEFSPPLSKNRGEFTHTVLTPSAFIVDDKLDNFYPQAASQIDGLMHVEHPTRGFYGGRPRSEVLTDLSLLGVDVFARHGILGRGVLVDLARHCELTGRQVDFRDNDTFTVPFIDEAAETQGVTIEPGDVLLLRTGWLTFHRRLSPQERAALPRPLRAPGLEPSRAMISWLWDRHVSMVAADNPALEAFPSTAVAEEVGDDSVPSEHRGLIHSTLIPLLGLAIGELWDLDALADHMAVSGSRECLVVSNPLALPGGIGSPANAMAVV